MTVVGSIRSKSPSLNSAAFPSLRNENRYTLSTRLTWHTLIPIVKHGGEKELMWHGFHPAGVCRRFTGFGMMG